MSEVRLWHAPDQDSPLLDRWRWEAWYHAIQGEKVGWVQQHPEVRLGEFTSRFPVRTYRVAPLPWVASHGGGYIYFISTCPAAGRGFTFDRLFVIGKASVDRLAELRPCLVMKGHKEFDELIDEGE